MNIIMMHGLPGSGKSFLADRIAKRLKNAVVLKSVRFRRGLGDSSPERFDETNPKTQEEKDASYKELCAAAERALIEGKIPILDATFHKKYRRQWLYELAEKTNAKLILISVSCNEDVVFARLKKRKKHVDEDAFLKSKEAYQIMREQQDELEKTEAMIKHVNTANLDFEGLIRWLNHILS